MGLNRKKHNRNFPDRTKAQDGRLVTPFQREGERAIIGDFPGDPMGLSRKKKIEIYPIKQRDRRADS